MVSRDVEGGLRQLRIPGRRPYGPNYPIRFQSPDIIRMCTDFTNYDSKTLVVGKPATVDIYNSGTMFKANSIRDPDWNAGSSAPSTVDEEWLIASGMRYFIVSQAEFKLQLWQSPTDTHLANNWKLVAFACDTDTPLPGPDTSWSEMQYVYMKMKSRGVPVPEARPSGLTEMRFVCRPVTNWPARNIYEDPGNWGTFETLTTEGQDPDNIFNVWTGVAATNKIAGQAAFTFYLKVYIRYWVTVVRDTIVRTIPNGISNADFIPYSEWSTTQGNAENPDQAGGAPEVFKPFAPSGVATDLTGNSNLVEWYDNP